MTASRFVKLHSHGFEDAVLITCTYRMVRTLPPVSPCVSLSYSPYSRLVTQFQLDSDKRRKKDLTHPLAAQFQACNSPSAIFARLSAACRPGLDRSRSSSSKTKFNRLEKHRKHLLLRRVAQSKCECPLCLLCGHWRVWSLWYANSLKSALIFFSRYSLF
jgi:hypothetical protein